MGLPDRLKKVLVEKLPITVDTQQFMHGPPDTPIFQVGVRRPQRLFQKYRTPVIIAVYGCAAHQTCYV